HPFQDELHADPRAADDRPTAEDRRVGNDSVKHRCTLHPSGVSRNVLLTVSDCSKAAVNVLVRNFHSPRNSPSVFSASLSLRSARILIVARMGTAMNAPGVPQMTHQKMTPTRTATGL